MMLPLKWEQHFGEWARCHGNLCFKNYALTTGFEHVFDNSMLKPLVWTTCRWRPGFCSVWRILKLVLSLQCEHRFCKNMVLAVGENHYFTVPEPQNAMAGPCEHLAALSAARPEPCVRLLPQNVSTSKKSFHRFTPAAEIRSPQSDPSLGLGG